MLDRWRSQRIVDSLSESVHAFDGSGRGDPVSQVGDVSAFSEFFGHVDCHLSNFFLKMLTMG